MAEGRGGSSRTIFAPTPLKLGMLFAILAIAVLAKGRGETKVSSPLESSSPRQRDASPAFLREISSRDSARCDKIHYSKSPPSRVYKIDESADDGQTDIAENTENEDEVSSQSTAAKPKRRDLYSQSMYENNRSENASKHAPRDYHPPAAVKSSFNSKQKTQKKGKGSPASSSASSSSSPSSSKVAVSKQQQGAADDDDDDDRELDPSSPMLGKSSPSLGTPTTNSSLGTPTTNRSFKITDSINARNGDEHRSDPLTQLSQEQLTSYLLNRPRGPSLLMPHLPSRPEKPHLLGGVKNVDDDQAYIEYWAEFRITRETTPKGLNNWFLAWIPNSEYSQTEYFSPILTQFLSKNHVFEVTAELSVKWYLDMFGSIPNFKRLRSLWLRLDDLRESSYRISSDGIDYRECINAGFRKSGWNTDLGALFSLLNEIMFQTWRGYIHPQRAPQIFFSQYRKLVEATMMNSSKMI